jgi:hypothetical protein
MSCQKITIINNKIRLRSRQTYYGMTIARYSTDGKYSEAGMIDEEGRKP